MGTGTESGGKAAPDRRKRNGRQAMIRGIGLDLCEVARMVPRAEDERFLKRYFTEAEAAYVRKRGRSAGQSLAGLFAAKEAFAKALGTGIAFELREVEIIHDAEGCPAYRLSGRAAELAGSDRFLLSISHDGGMAGAVCVRESPAEG